MSTELPDLPRSRQTKEATFGVEFRHWIENNRGEFPRSASFELKQSDGAPSLPFSAVESAQIAYAHSVAGAGVLIRVQGVAGEPDYVWMAHAPAYVAIKYPSCFVVISMWVFVKERDASTRKSLTEDRARVIADIVVNNVRAPPAKAHTSR